MTTLKAATRSGTRKTLGRTLALFIALLAAFAGSGILATPAQAQIIPGRCEYTNSQPQIRRGSSGTAVRQAQCQLNWSMTGNNLNEDGDFGSLTDAATRRFQGCAGLTVDGIIGPNTWRELNYWAASAYYVC